jgi:DNA-binding SARP family transcriptional activator
VPEAGRQTTATAKTTAAPKDLRQGARGPTPVANARNNRLAPVVRRDQKADLDQLKRLVSRGQLARRGFPAETHGTTRVPIMPIGYGLLGAAVVGVIDRMRRAQKRHRRSGLRIALPESDLLELEHGLRLGADAEAAEWIDLGQRLLSIRVFRRSGHVTPPRVVAARLCPAALELIVDPSSVGNRPPSPFIGDENNNKWILPRDPELLATLRSDPEVIGSEAPLPALVTLGLDDQGLLLLNLERTGSLAVSGRRSEGLVQAMTVEMACSKWADQVDILLVGLPAEVKGLERVFQAPSIASVIERLERRVRERRKLLEIVHQATNFETRWIEGGDAWDLCVVVCMASAVNAEREALDDLIRLAGDGSYGLAVVCVSVDAKARAHVDADGGSVSFDGLMPRVGETQRPTLRPQCAGQDFAMRVSSLVDIASHTEGVPLEILPHETDGVETGHATCSHSSSPSNPKGNTSVDDGPTLDIDTVIKRESEVEVRVLGPVEIIGATRSFTRAWAAELVIYLAMHRANGASTDQWATALWPDRVMAPASLHSTASAARRALGLSRSGQDHLPRSHGRLTLGPDVKTDWDCFVGFARSEVAEDWRQALQLIRGRPFEGLRAPDWTLLEGVTATIEALVVDLSCRYAELCLSAGDPDEAEWGARQGLRISAYDERLYRVLLRTADAMGNPAGVESVMSELTHLVADDVEPFDAVHPETVELYRALSRRPFNPRRR